MHAIAELFWIQDNCFKCTFLVPDSHSMHWLLTSCYQWGSEIGLTWEHFFQAVWLIFLQAIPSCCTPFEFGHTYFDAHDMWFFQCQCVLRETESLWRGMAKTCWPSCSPASQLAACSRIFCQDLLDKSEIINIVTAGLSVGLCVRCSVCAWKHVNNFQNLGINVLCCLQVLSIMQTMALSVLEKTLLT